MPTLPLDNPATDTDADYSRIDTIDLPVETPDAFHIEKPPFPCPAYQRAADLCGLTVYAQEEAIKIIEKITFTDGTSVSLDDGRPLE